ncbi:MAG: helix-turn-helix transcriptional regulator [Deltaproteobacteria bacterium]|nr:helix-turn-helix transcriptional regulator [Deltaproteobacteria bacterium]
MAVLMAADIVGDLVGGTDAFHVSMELGVMAIALIGVKTMWGRFVGERRRAARERALLAAARDAAHGEAQSWRREAETWRAEAQSALRGMGEAIDRQFERWHLTEAEREVAMLLLKGLSHQEIAAVRGTSERTARQQALAVYQKSGVSGRAELAAFFLEDMLVPTHERTDAP